MFTGRPLHEHRAGIVGSRFLDGRFPTLAEALRDRGYATGGFIANTFWTGRHTGLARGFVHYEDFYGNVADAVIRTVLGRVVTFEVLPKVMTLEIPGLRRAATVNEGLLRWVDRVDDRPWFAFVNYFDVHAPYHPPRETRGRFGWRPASARGAGLDIGALEDQSGIPPKAELDRRMAGYDESMLYVDQEIGRLAEELRRRGALDNTIVIITSDHGESWGEHGVIQHGEALWYDQLHVPLIVRYPRAIPGAVRVAYPVTNQWIPATVAQLTGMASAPFPGPALLPTDLHAALRAARAESGASDGAGVVLRGPGPDTILVQVGRRTAERAGDGAKDARWAGGRPGAWPAVRGWVAGAIHDRWHFILEEGGRRELFDYVADPAETTNLINDDISAVAADPLHAHLSALSLERGLAPGRSRAGKDDPVAARTGPSN
jgi:arylsulfatase A-like enzyme